MEDIKTSTIRVPKNILEDIKYIAEKPESLSVNGLKQLGASYQRTILIYMTPESTLFYRSQRR